MVSGRLSAALRPAGLTEAAVFAVCMLLAEAIAALPIAALLEEPLSNPEGAPSYGSRKGMPYIPSTQSGVRDQDQSPDLLQTFLDEAKSKKRTELDKLKSSMEQDGLKKSSKEKVKEMADYVKGEVTSIRNDVTEINATDTNEIQAPFHLVEAAITMAGDTYGALAAQGHARGCCCARARACVHTRGHSCGQLSPTAACPCLAQPVCGGAASATEAVRLGAAQGVASLGGQRSEAASGSRQQT
jgi:hypothetical protein